MATRDQRDELEEARKASRLEYLKPRGARMLREFGLSNNVMLARAQLDQHMFRELETDDDESDDESKKTNRLSSGKVLMQEDLKQREATMLECITDGFEDDEQHVSDNVVLTQAELDQQMQQHQQRQCMIRELETDDESDDEMNG